MESARRAVEDARTALDRAKRDLANAKDEHTNNNRSITTAEDNLVKAQNNLADAQRSYERALGDKERAIQDYTESNETKLVNAQRAFTESQNQLQSAQNNLLSAQNSLNQAESKASTANINVDIQSLNLEKLNNQFTEGLIIATSDGVVTEVNTTVGAIPNGVLFVIEDIDNLYISAKVKEYSLIDLRLGQQVHVMTEATGGKIYDAEVTFISPKAVSVAGSTSVEFEIHADMKGNDTDIKIGMNAFISIVVETSSDAYAIPLTAIITDARGSFVYADENGAIREIAVTIGMRTSTQVEIYSDELDDGLLILVKPNDSGDTAARATLMQGRG
jgi:multidrug efflux pump subunit AcrA (membrane-fusion protein)